MADLDNSADAQQPRFRPFSVPEEFMSKEEQELGNSVGMMLQAQRDKKLEDDFFQAVRDNASADDETRFARADKYFAERYGIETRRGAIINSGKDFKMKPFDTPDAYERALLALADKGYEAIASDRYKVLVAAERMEDEAARRAEIIRLGNIQTLESVVDVEAQRFVDAGSPMPPTKLVPRKPEDIDADIANYRTSVLGENFMAVFEHFRPDLSERGEEIVRSFVRNGSLPAENEGDFMALYREDPREGDLVKFLCHMAKETEYDLNGAAGRGLVNMGANVISQAGEKIGQGLYRLGVGFDAMDHAWTGSAADRMARMNREERDEYERVLSVLPNSLTDAERERRALDHVAPMMEKRYRREMMAFDDRVRERRVSLALADLKERREWEHYGYWENAYIGAATTIPYMAVTAIPYAGFAVNVFAHMQDVEDQIIREGGDPSKAVAARAIGAVTWAAIEKLELKGFTKSLTALEKTVMWRHLWQGQMKLALGELGEAAKVGGRELLVNWVKETSQEGLQGGIEAVERDLGLGKDAAATFRDALSAAWKDAKDSAGTMAIISAAFPLVGGVARAPFQRRRMQDHESVLAYLQRQEQLKNMLEGAYQPEPETPEIKEKRVRKAYDEIQHAWDDAATPMEAMHRFQDMGYTEDESVKIAEYFDMRSEILRNAAGIKDEAEALRDAALAGNAFRIGQDTTFNPADLFHIINSSIVTEEVEVPTPGETDAKPQTALRVTVPMKDADGAETSRSFTVITSNKTPDIETASFASSVAEATKGTDAEITPERYLAMARDEKEAFLLANDLKEGGNFAVLDAEGREIFNSDALVRLARANSAFVRKGGNWTLAHETAHAIVAFAREIGVFAPDAETTALMRKLFGDPTNDKEAWNEERMADGFAEYLRGKFDFKGLTRDERGIVERIFDAVIEFFKTAYYRLTGRTPDPAAVEMKAREQAMDAVFEGIRSGDFSGLSAFAGIDFKEDEKAEEEPATPGEAARPDATASAPGESTAQNPPKTPQERAETPKAANSTPDPSNAAQAAEERVKRTHAQSRGAQPSRPAPATSQSAQIAALQQQMARMEDLLRRVVADPAAVAASVPSPREIPKGEETRATPQGGVKFKIAWQWIPRAELVTSDKAEYPQEFQPRDRASRVASDMQVIENTRPGRFDPMKLAYSYDSDGGAPIVAGGNVVLSGNGRSMMLARLAQEGRYAEYLARLADWAEEYGIGRPPPNMAEPVLVQRIVSTNSRADLLKIAELSNRAKILTRSEAENAEADAKGLTNADGTPTDQCVRRVQNALLSAVLGSDPNVRSLLKILLEKRGDLGLGDLYRALIKSSGALLANRRTKAAYDLLPHVRLAVSQFVGWRSARVSNPRYTLDEHLRTSDMFAAAPSKEAEAVARLLEAGRFGRVIEKYNDFVAQKPPDSQASFFAEDTAYQTLAKAERAVLAEGETPVTLDPADPLAAEPLQSPPVEADPDPLPLPTESGSEAVAPREEDNAPFVPLPIRRGTATIPPANAPQVSGYLVDAEGKPITPKKKLPVGAYNLLRAPFDVRRPPAPSVQDKAGRGLSIGYTAREKAPDGSWWGDIFPHFQGYKTEMADRTSQAIRRNMTRAERESYRTVVDYFGGGGCWGLYHALTNFTKADRLVINEFEGGRLAKIRLLHERGEAVADDAKKLILEEIYAELRKACEVGADGGESGSGATIANKLESIAQRYREDETKFGLLFAFMDCAHTMLANRLGPDGRPSFDAGFDAVVDNLRADGRRAKDAADAFKARGGQITYRQGDAASFADAPSGPEVVAVCDPPYYLTAGYNGQVSVPLDAHGEGWDYKTTRSMLEGLVDKGDAIVYTDEAWWNKESYTPDQQEDLFGEGSPYAQEQEILLGIINALDHFDVAGRVAGRQEVLGVHHGHKTVDGRAERIEDGSRGIADDERREADGLGIQGGDTRHSVRRVDAGAEGEDERSLRDGRGGGRESRAGLAALAREVAAVQIEEALADAGADLTPAAAYAVRHSVRQVRDERIAAYARTVSANAKRWIADAAKRLDATMKAAGYTERVWHGTYGGDFNVFKFSANSHDVPAAYFTYNRGTAQNYAALTGEDQAWDEADDSLYNTRQFYVNPGKCLEWDEAENPTSLQDFIAKLRQAYEDGYNSVRVKNALDDQGARLDEFDNGPMTFLEADEMPGDGEGNFQTDILIVMQQPGDNAAARIKAADPVTFMDAEEGSLPIPPEMRADQTFADVRYSVNRAWANSAPMTAREIRRAVEEFGTTTDPKLVAYITPDGEWLDYDQMGEHADVRWSYTHRHRDELDKELIDEGDATPYVAAAIKGGLVRVTGGIFTASGDPVELGIQFTGRPDAKTLDNIRAFFAAVAERYPAARLLVECVGPSDDADWARQYAPGETGRIDRELREFAATGEPPAQVGPSLVAEFHERHSVLSSGRYYGTGLREVAHGLKAGNRASIDYAADLMAQNVPENAVLVPMPGHEGPATTMLPLAEAIAKRVRGAKVVDALVAEPHESNYTHKQRVHRPVKVVMHRTAAKLPKGRPVLVVDNVIASGATYRAAQAVIPGADLLTLADAGRETRGQRERMRHSVFMGTRGAVYDKPILNRLYEAVDMAVEKEKNKRDRKWYTPKVRDEIYAKTGWWYGTDGKWRVEIPDMKPKKLGSLPDGDFKGELAHPVALPDLVSNTRLFKAYSELKHVTVWFVDADSDSMRDLAGYLSGDDIVMTWDDLTTLDPADGEIKLTHEGLQTLTHEVQHYVQFIERFATGGSPRVNGKRNYALLAGEVEARNAERRTSGPWGTLVSARQDEAMRRLMMDHGYAPWQTQDVPDAMQLISSGDGRQTDINGRPVPRHSVRRGRSPMKPEDVAAGFLAARFLAGKETSVEDADRMLKNVGIRVDAPAMLERARALADRNRESLRASVEARNPEVVANLARANLADRAAEAIKGAITSGAAAADPDIGVTMQRAADRFAARELQAAKGFTAAQMQAELPISLADAVFAVAEYEKSPEEKARLEAEREKRERERAEREAAAAEEGESPVAEAERLAADESYREPAAEERAYFDQLMDRARFAEEARQQEELRRKLAEEKARKEAEGNADNADDDDDGGQSAAEESLPFDTVKRIAPVFESADLFAQFLVEWTADHVLKKHPELPSTAELWRSPVAIKELVQTAQHILRDLAKDTLGSPSINAARNHADQAIINLADYKTFRAIRRNVAHIYDRIHDNALRISRRRLVRDLVKDLRRIADIKGRFSATTEAAARTIDAKTEQWCRWLIPYLTMTEEKLQAETDRLQAIIARHDTEDEEYGYDKEDDTRYVEAKDRLAILNVYGGMVRWLPGKIVDARDHILEQVNGKRQAFEQQREERANADKAIRDAIIAAVEAGATPDFRKEGRAWRKTDAYIGALMGNLNLELQNLVRYCKDEAKREAALAAFDELAIVIGEASERYRLVQGQANSEINKGLEAYYGSADKGIRHLLEEEIPEDAAKRIFTQSRQVRPTYGQLLQLYATTLQGDYKENAEKHGRAAMLQLMEETLTPQDIQFHAWAVNWYAANRAALSDAVEEITGLPVTSPDRLYCPARMERDVDGFSVDAVAWSPVPSALNRRIAHNLDFNEAANFLALLNEQAEIRAQTIGYGMAGIRLRDIIAHHDVQKAVRKHVGKADMKRVTDHVKDVLVQGAARKGESAFFAGLNWARRWIARFYLAGNLPSAIKQLASRPVWANVVGFKNALRYYATVATAEGRQAIRDLVASDGFKARYRMGWSEETQNVLRHPSKFKTLEWVYSKGMLVNKAVDAISCLWMAQGFYRDALKAQLDKGFSPDEAKERALALTWSVTENGQQSGRIENMNQIQRKGGEGAAAVFQFMTAYLLQNNYELQAIRECKAGTPGAKGRLIRAMIINHVLIPGYVELVMVAWRALMGEEPLPDEPDKWPQYLKDLIWSCAFGPAAPLYMYSQMGKGLWDKLVGSKGRPTARGAIPAEAIVYPVEQVGSLVIDLGKGALQTFTSLDFEEEVTVEKLQEDFWKAASSVAAPVRHARKAIKNREE